MSELINNRQEKLKKIIKMLHDENGGLEKAKKEFGRLIKNVSADEISSMEQTLIKEGFPVSEIQRLCDVHVSVFEQSLKRQKSPKSMPGHPVHTYKLENIEAKKRIRILKKTAGKLNPKNPLMDPVKAAFEDLSKIIIHYTRKENQLFPFLEKKGFTGPSKVMWGKHDEIRAMLKEADSLITRPDVKALKKKISELTGALGRMIFMEEHILFPSSMSKLSETDWAEIKLGEPEIGYAWVVPGDLWDANMVKGLAMKKGELSKVNQSEEVLKNTVSIPEEGTIPLNVGALTAQQISLMLTHLPFDVTYVDENDKVQYYTGSEERVFPRSPGIIGREVQNCHPPKSVHIVEQIVDAFKKKEKKSAEFWIPVMGRLIHIRYFAVYDEKGNYRGVIEVTQDITQIVKITGEKRLLDWNS
jgi:hypothetical protein